MNKELCEKFPFLIPHNRFTDKVPEDWNYEYTELDAMPEGWRRAFGLQMCEELEEELERIGKQNEWRIMQIKEKFGFLHFYSNWYTKELNKIITKYEEKSKYRPIYALSAQIGNKEYKDFRGRILKETEYYCLFNNF